MGWTEFKAIPNEYNDEVQAIDKQIITLIMKRKEAAKGKRLFPPQELLSNWANEFDMEAAQLNAIIDSFSIRFPVITPQGPGKLVHVLPIMKKTILDGFEYELTHAMQHENGSIVFVEIYQTETDDFNGHMRPKLQLEVTGEQEYSVHRDGASGGSGHTQLSFLVIPRLPDSLDQVRFKLIPYAPISEYIRKEIILNQEVAFE
ncbi:hypothetical protein ET464_04695 [Paenibacillus protaetiae]|uniref:Uncharacterized protein n=2 Tax=Paenibacillus protaetiae TaxID=2509456 RepID=A0A4P6F578_9BACL|nr:hypothetical protein ET464_04695 [Paenibacillus protaetiae]